MRRVVVDARNPDDQALQDAAFVIRTGGIVAIPTDTLYGLAVSPFNVDAVARVFALKRRRDDRAMPLVAADITQVTERIGPLPAHARRLASHFWPGPLTIVLPAPPTLAPAVTGGTGTVGVRVPAHEVTRALCWACLLPLTATSANISGAAPATDPDDVERTLGGWIDLLIDAGPAPGGAPSTIVDATGPNVTLVREGAIPWAKIETAARTIF